jgi:hypothetical protein
VGLPFVRGLGGFVLLLAGDFLVAARLVSDCGFLLALLRDWAFLGLFLDLGRAELVVDGLGIC